MLGGCYAQCRSRLPIVCFTRSPQWHHWKCLVVKMHWLQHKWPPGPSSTAALLFISCTKLCCKWFISFTFPHTLVSSQTSPLSLWDGQQVCLARRGLSLAAVTWQCSRRSWGQVCSPWCWKGSGRKHLMDRRRERRWQRKSVQVSQKLLSCFLVCFHGTPGVTNKDELLTEIRFYICILDVINNEQ